MALVQALALALEMREPYMEWGHPGTGKTARTEATGAVLGRKVFTVIASLHEPTDIGGIPALVNRAGTDDRIMKFFPMDVMVELVESRNGILFIDEFSNSAIDMQKVLMNVTHARRAGYLLFPPGVSIACAGNPPESNAGGGDLTPALANRLLHFDTELDVDAWAAGMDAGWPAPTLYKLPIGWERGLKSATGFITGFIRRSGKAYLHAMPKEGSREASRGWPSPRTWEKVIKIETACTAAGADPATRNLMIVAAVGSGAANELETFRRDRELPKPEDVLANPQLADEKREDRQQRIVETSIAHASNQITVLIGKNQTAKAEKVWQSAWAVLGVVAKTRADVAVPYAQNLFRLPAALKDGAPRFTVPEDLAGSLYTVLMGEV